MKMISLQRIPEYSEVIYTRREIINLYITAHWKLTIRLFGRERVFNFKKKVDRHTYDKDDICDCYDERCEESSYECEREEEYDV